MALNIGITVRCSTYGFGRYLLGFFTQSEEIISLGMIQIASGRDSRTLELRYGSSFRLNARLRLFPAACHYLQVFICTIRIARVFPVFAAKPDREILMMVYPPVGS